MFIINKNNKMAHSDLYIYAIHIAVLIPITIINITMINIIIDLYLLSYILSIYRQNDGQHDITNSG